MRHGWICLTIKGMVGVGLEVEDGLGKMEGDNSCSSLTGKVETCSWSQQEVLLAILPLPSLLTNQLHSICWLQSTAPLILSPPLTFSSPPNFRTSLQLKWCWSLTNFSPQFPNTPQPLYLAPFWPTGLPSFGTACHPTFLTFFNTRNCSYFSELSAVLALPTG